jgi:hypothetical protein
MRSNRQRKHRRRNPHRNNNPRGSHDQNLDPTRRVIEDDRNVDPPTRVAARRANEEVMTWRTATILLALICAGLVWRDCRRPAIKKASAVDCDRSTSDDRSSVVERRHAPDDDGEDPAKKSATAAPADGFTLRGFHVPGWAMRLLPQKTENLLAYRDRIVPLAQMAVAPHRSRVARGRDDFAKVANLDARQRAELDAAVGDAASQIQDRVLGAALGGELSPQVFKPMTGVAIARDVLDIVDRANKRFVGSLGEDQRAALAKHPFDLGDYLVFSTSWEDALGYTNP